MMYFQEYLKAVEKYLVEEEKKENLFEVVVAQYVFSYLYHYDRFVNDCLEHNIDVISTNGKKNFQEWMWG